MTSNSQSPAPDSSSESPTPDSAGNKFQGSDVQSSRRRMPTFKLTGPRRMWLITAAATFALFTGIALLQPPRSLPHPPADISAFSFWLFPIATNEIARLPRPLVNGAPGPTFNAVSITLDGMGIWVAGDAGILLHSGDGGFTWRQLPPNPRTVATFTENRQWSPIPSVEAAVGNAIGQAPASSQNAPPGPSKLSGVLVSGPPNQDNAANPASQSKPGASNPSANSPQSQTQIPAGSQPTVPVPTRRRVPARPAQNVSGSHLRIRVLYPAGFASCKGSELLACISAQKPMDTSLTEDQLDVSSPISDGNPCKTNNGGVTWNRGLDDSKSESAAEILQALRDSGSNVPTLPTEIVLKPELTRHQDRGLSILFATDRSL